MITALEPSRLLAVKAKVVGADDVIDPLAVDPASVFPETASAPAYGFECGSRGGGTESALRVLRPRRGA